MKKFDVGSYECRSVGSVPVCVTGSSASGRSFTLAESDMRDAARRADCLTRSLISVIYERVPTQAHAGVFLNLIGSHTCRVAGDCRCGRTLASA